MSTAAVGAGREDAGRGDAGREGPGRGDARRKRPVEELAFAGLIALLGVVTLAETGGIAVPGSSNTMGPRAFPYMVGVALLTTGTAVVVGVLRGRYGVAEEGEDIDPEAGTDWLTLAKLGATFAVHILLVERIGWPLAAAVLFLGAAWSLGARSPWRAAAIGLVLGVVVQVLFVTGLGVSLPAGLLRGVPFLDG